MIRRHPRSPLFSYTTLFRSTRPFHTHSSRRAGTPGRRAATRLSTKPAEAVRAESISSISPRGDRKSTRLNSSHTVISYAVFCLKKKKKKTKQDKNNKYRPVP